MNSDIARHFSLRLLAPFFLFLGKIFSGSREYFEKKIVKLNNDTVRSGKFRGLIVLLPHCLQFDACPHRVTTDILNCKSCGKCDIADILKIEEKFDIIVKIATGGRLAKKWVEENRSELVVAVACERELCEGILAVYPTKVFAIPNIRPMGPCINTKVNINDLKTAIEKFLEKS